MNTIIKMNNFINNSFQFVVAYYGKRTLTIQSNFLACCSSKELSPNEIKHQKIKSKLKAGNPFPDFNLINNENEYKNQKDFDEGYVFYMFWATWCQSCVDNIVAVKEMKRAGLLGNVQFVSVSFDEEEPKWGKFINQFDMADFMDNLFVGNNKEHKLNDFRFKEFQKGIIFKEKNFGYVMPAYCLVENGKVKDRDPILPKSKDDFLKQF